MNDERRNESRQQIPIDPHRQSDMIGASADGDDMADRLIRHLVHNTSATDVPAGFATRMARHVEEHRHVQPSSIENWLTWLALLCAGIAGLALAWPGLLDAWRGSLALAKGVPWPMLLAAALSFAFIGGIDAVLDRRRSRAHV